ATATRTAREANALTPGATAGEGGQGRPHFSLKPNAAGGEVAPAPPAGRFTQPGALQGELPMEDEELSGIREQLGEDLAEAVVEAVAEAGRDATGLQGLGFTQDEFGQFIAEACKVIIYPSCGEFEIDIILPGGGVIGFDVTSLSGRSAEQRKAG